MHIYKGVYIYIHTRHLSILGSTKNSKDFSVTGLVAGILVGRKPAYSIGMFHGFPVDLLVRSGFAALSVAYSVSLGSLLPAHSLARLGPSVLVLDAVATGGDLWMIWKPPHYFSE